MSESIVVVGSINVDLVVRAKRIPLAGETLSGTDFQIFSGGKGANQAVAAARLGVKTQLIGKVGSDIFGQRLKQDLEAAGVDVTAVAVQDGPSGVALISIAESGQNSIIVVPAANGGVSADDLQWNLEQIKEAGLLLTQLEIPLDTVKHLCELATTYNIPLILDPAPAITLPISILRSVEWLTPNETEICSLLEVSAEEMNRLTLDSIAKRFQQMGAKNILLKLGERGCFVQLQDGTSEFIKAYEVEAVDTTAAGDAFNSAFAAALLQGEDPIRSAKWASAVAAVTVTRSGAQSSMPTRREVEIFLTNHLEPYSADIV